MEIYSCLDIPIYLKLKKIDNIYVINPGSTTLPKENNPHTYGILEGEIFKIKDLEGNIYREIKIVK